MESGTPTKTCTACGRKLPATLEFFYAQTHGALGLGSRCKDCVRKRRREKVAANPEEDRRKRAEYYVRTRDRRLAHARQWRQQHLDEVRAQDREKAKHHGVCQFCGREYFGTGEKYCSRECQAQAAKNRITFTCKHCGKEVSAPASRAKFGNPAYCSQGCWYAHAHQKQLWGKLKPKVLKACETCGKPLLVHASAASRTRFCSQKCMLVWRGPVLSKLRREDHKRRVMTCLWCGEQFTKLECATKDGRGQFCSRQCLGAYTVKYKRQVVSLMEQRFVEVLRVAGLSFDTQARMGKFVVDVCFTQEKVAVEFDGDYWHSLPAMVARDKRKDVYLIGEGYRVLHILQSDFVADPDGCVLDVLEALTPSKSPKG